MKKEVTARSLTVFVEMIIIKVIYNIHNLNTKLCGCIRMTKSVVSALFCHENIDRIRKTDKPEHACESVSMDKPFL